MVTWVMLIETVMNGKSRPSLLSEANLKIARMSSGRLPAKWSACSSESTPAPRRSVAGSCPWKPITSQCSPYLGGNVASPVRKMYLR